MFRHVEPCMGTMFSFDLRSEFDQSAFGRTLDWLHWVDTTFSTYRPDSDISQIDVGRRTVAQCPPEVGLILDLCEELRVVTGGYFDTRAAGSLDPSGVVKGWAVDNAHDQLRAAGSTRHCINAGGDIRCTGGREEGRPWRLGVSDPRARDRIIAVAESEDLAMATSGTAERGHHIVDPHTGRPPTALLSLSVIGADLTTVDALATAAFAMGPGAQSWLEQREGIEAFAVTTDRRSWSTAGWAGQSPTASLPRRTNSGSGSPTMAKSLPS
jgi:thiamine biosynthesis lipoprotein